jgi:hypothetical protein
LGIFDIYRVNTTSNQITITLIQISSLTNNRGIFTFTDVGGALLSNNLILQCSGIDTIAGSQSIILNTNYSSITLIADYLSGTRWLIN